VDVTVSGNSEQETAWAADPTAWYERLKKEQTCALRLHYGAAGGKTVGTYHVPDRMLAGFVGGGGRWLIETIGPRGSDYWEARWEVGDRARADRRIWRVTYGRIAHDQVTRGSDSEDLETLKRKLETTLTEIQSYASAHNLETFAAIFQKSRSQLSADAPGKGVYHADLTVTGQLSPAAQQLLAASQLGWVFGGMGSWNDTPHDEADKEYERLSEELFTLLNQSYVAVANTTAAATRLPSAHH
jgi:hypothetical protein